VCVCVCVCVCVLFTFCTFLTHLQSLLFNFKGALTEPANKWKLALKQFAFVHSFRECMH